MVIKKKIEKTKQQPSDKVIENFINHGGKTSVEVDHSLKNQEDMRFTLRIPKEMVEQIDNKRKKRIGHVSRNNWILEAIAEKCR